MTGKRCWRVLLIAVAVLAGASSAWATHNPHLGRFNQRDPIGYPDGMNGYEYVASSPYISLDPEGKKLCFVEALVTPESERLKLKQRAKRIEAWIQKLHPKADRCYDGVVDEHGEYVCTVCYDTPQGNTLPERLVSILARSDTVYWLDWGEPMYSWKPRPTIDMNDRTVKVRYLRSTKTGEVEKAKNYPRNDMEHAGTLAHEMIHAMYVTELGFGARYSKRIREVHVYEGKEGKKGTGMWLFKAKGDKVLEEELYTVGLNVATVDRKQRKVNIIEYDAKFTENKILRALGSKYERASYRGGKATTKEFNKHVTFNRHTKRR
jgi:hypothetical protein